MWTIFKVSVEWLQNCFCLCFTFFGYKAWGILAPHQASNPHALHWKAESSPLDRQRTTQKVGGFLKVAGDIKPGKSCHMSTAFKKMKGSSTGEFSSVASGSGLDPSVDRMRPTWRQCKELPESWSCLAAQTLLC